MRYTVIPGLSLRVSAICLGTADMNASLDGGTSRAILDRFCQAGGNFLDTAHVYADWIPGPKSSSEKFLGEWMATRGNRDSLVIATKGAHPRLDTPKVSRMNRADIAFDINEGLKFLRTDRIDLFYLHRDDPCVPVGEIIDMLNEHVSCGSVRAIGCSNWPEHRIAEANAYAHAHNRSPFCAVQNLWTMASVDMRWIPDTTLFKMDKAIQHLCRTAGIAAIPYSSQANGFFAKKAAAGQLRYDPTKKGTYESALSYARLRAAVRIAAEIGTSITAVSLAYLTNQPMCTIPVIGPKKRAQLDDSLGAADLILTQKHLDELERGDDL